MKTRIIALLVRSILIAAVVLITLPGVKPAAAFQPLRQFVPSEPGTMTGVCSFDVYVEITMNNLYAMTFYDQYGNVTYEINSGAVIFTLTNLSTNEAITYNISGPGRWVYNLDGSGQGAWLGPWLISGPPNSYFGWPPLVVFSGRVAFSWDTNGNLIEASYQGHYIDVCAELGD